MTHRPVCFIHLFAFVDKRLKFEAGKSCCCLFNVASICSSDLFIQTNANKKGQRIENEDNDSFCPWTLTFKKGCCHLTSKMLFSLQNVFVYIKNEWPMTKLSMSQRENVITHSIGFFVSR